MKLVSTGHFLPNVNLVKGPGACFLLIYTYEVKVNNMAASVGRMMSISMDMQVFNDVLRSLEEGSTLTAFFKTKKPEAGMFRIKLETRELVGTRTRGKPTY